METSITTRTKTTDLGKIVLTNGREYNPETTYEKNTFVLFRNSTYLALQTIVGVEPSNDLVNWQLMAKGFAGDDFVADRYVFVDRDEESEVAGEPMIDADALGGNKPDFYAPQHEISDQFSKEKDYDVGDYCIYLNRLYRFISAKPAGEWDGTAVIPVTIAEELQGIQDGVTKLNADLKVEDISNKIAKLSDSVTIEHLVAKKIRSMISVQALIRLSIDSYSDYFFKINDYKPKSQTAISVASSKGGIYYPSSGFILGDGRVYGTNSTVPVDVWIFNIFYFCGE